MTTLFAIFAGAAYIPGRRVPKYYRYYETRNVFSFDKALVLSFVTSYIVQIVD